MTKKSNNQNESNIKQFEVGKVYGMNSACDSECWWYYRVEARTKSTITLRQIHSDGSDYNETQKCRVLKKDTEFFKAEALKPLGDYSMCPILTAEKECEPMTRKEREEVEEKEPVQMSLDFAEPAEEPTTGAIIIDGTKICEFRHIDATEETDEDAEPILSEEVRREGTTPDGRELRMVERYDEEGINGGVFLICDGEETEYQTLITAETMYDCMMAQQPEPEATEEVAEQEQDKQELKTINALPDAYDKKQTHSRDLSDMQKAAERSYGWSSFEPERAGRVMIGSYQSCLDSDLAELPAESHDYYIEKFRQKVADLIAKNSRIASWAVTGPAKFNNRRNEKANNAYYNAVNAFEEWRKKFIAGAKRREENAKPAEQKMAEQWEAVKREIMETAASLKAIDEQHAPYTRSLFVSGLWGKMERIANKGNVEIIRKATDLIAELNEKMTKPIFTKRHLFWTLIDKAQAKCAKIEEISNSESATLSFEGYDIVRNFAEDRLQIIFADVPDSDMRNNLKHNGFRWSPRNKAWQRQLTTNAEYACAQVFGKQRKEMFATAQ